jgi:hypothetical protein
MSDRWEKNNLNITYLSLEVCCQRGGDAYIIFIFVIFRNIDYALSVLDDEALIYGADDEVKYRKILFCLTEGVDWIEVIVWAKPDRRRRI